MSGRPANGRTSGQQMSYRWWLWATPEEVAKLPPSDRDERARLLGLAPPPVLPPAPEEPERLLTMAAREHGDAAPDDRVVGQIGNLVFVVQDDALTVVVRDARTLRFTITLCPRKLCAIRAARRPRPAVIVRRRRAAS